MGPLELRPEAKGALIAFNMSSITQNVSHAVHRGTGG